MARIPDEELERLKREVSVQRLVEARGVALRKHGKDLIGLCPLHDDREPSLVVTPSRNLWHCLGACQAGGGPIDWVMRAEGVSFRLAVEMLRKDSPSLAAPDATSAETKKRSVAEKLPRLVEPEEPDHVVLERVVRYYQAQLEQSPEALEYLRNRGLVHPELISRFRLGYANRTLPYRLPPKNRKAGAVIRAQLERLGVLRESGHEHLNGSIVVPVFDAAGRVVEMYGRKIGSDLRKGTPLHLYLPGPHRGVFNLHGLEGQEEVILCESLIDALTFWCAGLSNVTASYGVEGLTEEHLEAFRRLGVRRVLVAYDRDDAGDRAAEKLGEKLAAAGMSSYRVLFPKGMDANEYALRVTPPSRSLELLVRNAEVMHEVAAAAVRAPVEAELAPAPSLAAASDPEPPATPTVRAAPKPPAVEPEVRGEEIVIELGDRRWRIRGLARNLSHEQLRVNVLVGKGEGFHVDSLELYSARQRASFLKQASEELSVDERVLKRDLGQVLLVLEELQDKAIREALAPKTSGPQMSSEDQEAAMALLRDPRLVDRILEGFERSGVVGEEVNKLVGYLAASSRKLDEPLAVVIQSSSAAGKSSLMEAILSFIPEEERVMYSAMTGQSLFYMGETDLAHKVLAIAEEEGAKSASYALKLLQSEGELTIASTGKDPSTGRLVTHEYRVSGPVMLFLTTTAVEIDEELLNRCLVLTVDEGREQTRAIHDKQRASQTLEGLLERQERGTLRKLHQDAQRLLRPLLVANPFAKELTFLDTQTRTRRDHMKYLTLIRSIALLHQYQREVKTVSHQGSTVRYIEVERSDIELANRLAHQVLGRSLDELPPQTRALLREIYGMVRARAEREDVELCDVRFSRREVREHTGLGHTQLKVHMARLEELEYVLVHRGGRGQRFVYELAYAGEGEDGGRFVPGLVDVGDLREYDRNRSGSEGDLSGGGRAEVGGWSGRGDRGKLADVAELRRTESVSGKNTAPAMRAADRSYVAASARS